MNWGKKISLVITIFIFFIVSMAVYMFRVHGNDELVEDDYYEKGIDYDQEYNAMRNVYTDKVEPTLSITESQLVIQLKDSTGYELKLKCASVAKADRTINGNTVGSSNLILIDKHKMRKGIWFLELRWNNKQKHYFFKKDIVL